MAPFRTASNKRFYFISFHFFFYYFYFLFVLLSLSLSLSLSRFFDIVRFLAQADLNISL